MQNGCPNVLYALEDAKRVAAGRRSALAHMQPFDSRTATSEHNYSVINFTTNPNTVHNYNCIVNFARVIVARGGRGRRTRIAAMLISS